MVYRPTVRYADEFKEYVDSLFHATRLDRNQIIRAALFTAAFSPNFAALLDPYKKADVPLPLPKWNTNEHGYWMDRTPMEHERGKDVNAIIRRENETERTAESIARTPTEQTENNRCNGQIERQERKVSSRPIRIANQGGITIKIG